MTDKKIEKKVIEFPTSFTIKVVGNSNDKFVQDILDIAKNEFDDFDESIVEKKLSSNGKYVSLSIKGTARNQDHLDGIYRQLTAHPHAKFVL